MPFKDSTESLLRTLNEALEAARSEMTRLHGERDQYEETMKKAFMRGVCALNLEAMSMFHQGEQVFTCGVCALNLEAMSMFHQGTRGETSEASRLGRGTVVPHEEVYQSGPPPRLPHPGWSPASTSHPNPPSASALPDLQLKLSSAAQKLGSRTITAKVTAKQKGPQLGQAGKGPGSVAMGLAPPMSSVMVERHHPVTQQTIGHATADRYPRMPSQSQQPLQQSQSTIAQRKVAGQAGKVHLGTPNVHSVKVVQ
ncbi:centrosomal protein POC5-like [Branchiostoma floridae]|uniref:Centrosomal protein POC5 n=1 Tax=Branchiostoma floridae TaxID=7739 RepID=A0A9J7MIR3_BRAFL|nr:centrosomal protein POC5-like [Branchiostoma floridae]